MLHFNISDEEKLLMNLVRENNSYDEIQELLSFKHFQHLQNLLWWTHRDSTTFMDMWTQNLNDMLCLKKEEHLLEILIRPKYTKRKTIRMQCIDIVDFGGRTVTKEFIEIKNGESFVPIEDVKTKTRATKNRVNFTIDTRFSMNTSLYEPQCNHISAGEKKFQPFLLNESSISTLKATVHMAIVDVEMVFQGTEKYYSSEARTKAVEFCNDKRLMEKLLVDSDMRVRNAAIKRLKADDNFSKEDIYKMLESNDVNVRLQGIKLLKEFDKD